VSRVIAGVLIATGELDPARVVRANEALSALGRPPLADHDFVGQTPEMLAPTIPENLRPAAPRAALRAGG